MDVVSSLELCPGSEQVLDQTTSGTEFEPGQDLPAVLGAQFGHPRLVGLTPPIQVNFFIKMFLENIPCAQREVCSSRRGFFLQRARHASSCGQEAIASGTCENRSLFIKKMYLYLLLQSLCSGAFLKFSWRENAYIKTKPKTLTDVPWRRKGCRHSKELRQDRQSYMDTGKESQINVCGWSWSFCVTCNVPLVLGPGLFLSFFLTAAFGAFCTTGDSVEFHQHLTPSSNQRRDTSHEEDQP